MTKEFGDFDVIRLLPVLAVAVGVYRRLRPRDDEPSYVATRGVDLPGLLDRLPRRGNQSGFSDAVWHWLREVGE